jgi:hypothetical protein
MSDPTYRYPVMNAEQRRIAGLRLKYPWIVKYGRMLGSYDYYIDNQVERAEATNAPVNAIHEQTAVGGERTGKWATIDDVINPDARDRLGLPPLEKGAK